MKRWLDKLFGKNTPTPPAPLPAPLPAPAAVKPEALYLVYHTLTPHFLGVYTDLEQAKATMAWYEDLIGSRYMYMVLEVPLDVPIPDKKDWPALAAIAREGQARLNVAMGTSNSGALPA